MRHPLRIASALAFVLLAGVAAPASLGAAPSPQLERQWSIASGAAIELPVRSTMWYRVGRAKLLAAGLPRNAPVRSLRLFADGREVAIRVSGAVSGRLGPRGAIYFYGVAQEAASTDVRTYWFVWGAGQGRRVPVSSHRLKRKRVAQSFPETTKFEPADRYFTLNTDENDDSDHFYGPAVQPGKVSTQTITAVHPAPSTRPVLEVRLQGSSTFVHRVRVELNGSEVGTASFSGLGAATTRIQLRPEVLRAGANTVGLESTGGELDFTLLDWIQLTYDRLYESTGDRLAFGLAARRVGRIEGFTGRRVTVVDVTTPRSPRLVPAKVRRVEGGYTATIPAAPTRRRLLAFASRLARQVPAVRHRPSNWHRAGQGADMVVISHPAFISALRPLVELRQRQGLRVAVVNVDDLYDEFAFGAHGPEAIKEFLVRARDAWRPAPRYVLLVGDATVDPKNHLREPDEDFVPTKLLKTFFMRAPADDWFADFNTDGVPEMAVGRLPVRTADGAAAVVAKLVRYETVQPTGARSALLVADQNRGFNFETSASGLAELLTPQFTPRIALRSQSASDADFRSEVVAGLNQGPDVVAYVGHGSTNRWGAPGYLPPSQARGLRNERLSIYAITSCLNGYFVDPPSESLGEDLLEAPIGGAVAVWTSSALADGFANLSLNRGLFTRLSDAGTPTIGEKVVAAKRAAPDSDVRRSTVLLGDPATRVR